MLKCRIIGSDIRFVVVKYVIVFFVIVFCRVCVTILTCAQFF